MALTTNLVVSTGGPGDNSPVWCVTQSNVLIFVISFKPLRKICIYIYVYMLEAADGSLVLWGSCSISPTHRLTFGGV